MKQTDEHRRRDILNHYRRYPKATEAQIADRIKLSKAQTEREINALHIEGALARKVVVNLGKLGLGHKYRIDIALNPRELQDNEHVTAAGAKWNTRNPQEMLAHYLWDEYSQDDTDDPDLIFEDITILLGDAADLCLTVRVKNPTQLYDFITQKLRCVLGIENTSTCTEAWSAAEHRAASKLRASASSARSEKRGGTSHTESSAPR